MSASTEQLLERIRSLEEAIDAANTTGADASHMLAELRQLNKLLVSANESLNENKSLLKG